jgi:PIN domain nuclease of toxin-antitoxin system
LAGKRLLVDTHVLLWFVQETGRLRPRALHTLEHAAQEHGLYVSAVSFYEIGLLVRRGRLRPRVPPHLWPRQIAAVGINVLDLDAEIAVEAAALPGISDPFDEFLVATARIHGLTLATRDGVLLDYGAQGHVRTLEV